MRATPMRTPGLISHHTTNPIAMETKPPTIHGQILMLASIPCPIGAGDQAEDAQSSAAATLDASALSVAGSACE